MTSARARGKQELDAEICGMRFMYIRDCTSMHNDDVCFSLSVCVCACACQLASPWYLCCIVLYECENKQNAAYATTVYGIAVPTELVNVWIIFGMNRSSWGSTISTILTPYCRYARAANCGK